jgi:hypothetical protein
MEPIAVTMIMAMIMAVTMAMRRDWTDADIWEE